MLPKWGLNLKPLLHIGAREIGIKSAPTPQQNEQGRERTDASSRRHCLVAGARGQRAAFASATASAVMLMMRRTVAEGVRMCAGLAAPSSTGPMAMPPPAAVFSRL